jgi:hypothetical protein
MFRLQPRSTALTLYVLNAILAALTSNVSAQEGPREIRMLKSRMETLSSATGVRWPPLALVQVQAVQVDLGLTAPELSQLALFNDGLLKELRALDIDSGGVQSLQSREDRNSTKQKYIALGATKTAQLEDLLGKERMSRLKQISLQMEGASVLLGREMETALQLTPDQVEALRKINSEWRGKSRRAMVGGVVSPEEGAKIAAERQKQVDDRDEQLRATLTEQQRKAFGELQGKPFDASKLKQF